MHQPFSERSVCWQPNCTALALGKRAARFDPGYYSYVGNNGIYEEYTLERTWIYHAQLSTLDGIQLSPPQRGRMLISALPGCLNVLSPQTCSSSSLYGLLIPIHIGVIPEGIRRRLGTSHLISSQSPFSKFKAVLDYPPWPAKHRLPLLCHLFENVTHPRRGPSPNQGIMKTLAKRVSAINLAALYPANESQFPVAPLDILLAISAGHSV